MATWNGELSPRKTFAAMTGVPANSLLSYFPRKMNPCSVKSRGLFAPLRKIRASVFSIRKPLKVPRRQKEGLDNRMKKRLITVENVQYANNRLMDKACKVVLSAEDIVLFEQIWKISL